MKIAAFSLLSILIITGVSCSKNADIPESELKARILTNISYGADPLQKIDVYLPAKRSYSTPVIFLLHGGGFYGGDKSDFSLHSEFLSDQLFRPSCRLL